MENKSKVPFWLDIKKEYVKDNFVKMVEYLKWCQHNKTEIGDLSNPLTEYNRTLQVLRELSNDIVCSIQSKNIYDFENVQWNDVSDDVRMLITYLLADSIKGECDYKVILCVIELMLFASKTVTEEVLCKMRNVTISCIKEEKISYYGLSWDDVLKWKELSLDILRINFGQTVFIKKQGKFLHSGFGTILIDDDSVSLKIINGDKCFTHEKLISVDSLKCGVSIDVEKKNANAKFDDFDGVRNFCNELIDLQKNIKPFPKYVRKIYLDGDSLVVRVLFKHGNEIRAISIDQHYESIEGNIFIPQYICGIKSTLICEEVMNNDLLIVNFVDRKENPFVLGKAFVEFYEHYINTVDTETIGVMMDSYVAGYRWLTGQGVIVNVMGKDENLPDYVKTAIEERKPVCIDIKFSRRDKSGNIVINAEYSNDDSDLDSYDELVSSAMMNLLDAFREWTKERMPKESLSDKLNEFDSVCVHTLSIIAFYWSKCCSNSIQRYFHLTLAILMTGIKEVNNDYLYILENLKYLNQLVHFAHGKSNTELQYKPDNRFAYLNSIMRHKRIIDLLSEYKSSTETNRNYAIGYVVEDETEEMINNLVQASNTLVGKIAPTELDRIKKTITRYLGVDDEFVCSNNEMTYYGEESDKLEFKTSVVYPPEHEGIANPTFQIWNILKTVCGMMNSMSGGEIIIGVMDNGYSCGLQNDINYLYDSKMIAEPTMDKYRLFVKHWVDKTMTDEIDMVSGIALTSDRIRYVIERNDEQHDILRIQIMPFEYGIVVFNEETSRPPQISACYLRSSGATVPMNAEMKNQMRERKLHSSSDDRINKLVKLQKACKERKQVKLINYSSKTKIGNRIVEPYMLISEHDAYLCYDTTVKENPLREFKLKRMSDIEILSTNWKFTNRHKQLMVDIFGMLEKVDNPPFEIVLKLSPMSNNLLREEFKRAENFISANTDSDKDEFPYLLKTKICSIEGVGRFYIGLASAIKIVNCEQLKQYAEEYTRKYILGVSNSTN